MLIFQLNWKWKRTLQTRQIEVLKQWRNQQNQLILRHMTNFSLTWMSPKKHQPQLYPQNRRLFKKNPFLCGLQIALRYFNFVYEIEKMQSTLHKYILLPCFFVPGLHVYSYMSKNHVKKRNCVQKLKYMYQKSLQRFTSALHPGCVINSIADLQIVFLQLVSIMMTHRDFHPFRTPQLNRVMTYNLTDFIRNSSAFFPLNKVTSLVNLKIFNPPEYQSSQRYFRH